MIIKSNTDDKLEVELTASDIETAVEEFVWDCYPDELMGRGKELIIHYPDNTIKSYPAIKGFQNPDGN